MNFKIDISNLYYYQDINESAHVIINVHWAGLGWACPCTNSLQHSNSEHTVYVQRWGLHGKLRLLTPRLLNFFHAQLSSQLNTKFVLLKNVKMPTIVDILTFISTINTTSERLKAGNFFIYQYFSFNEQLKLRAQLSWAWKKFYNLGAWPVQQMCGHPLHIAW